MSWLLVAPILVPMLTGIVIKLAPLSTRQHGLLSVAGAGALTAVGSC